MSIRILLVDDQQLLRRGLGMLLRTVDDLDVVGEAADGREALALIPALNPDVVVSDARMPVMDGVALVAACRERHPTVPVLVLTTFDDDDLVSGALAAGAAGFLLKDTSTDELAAAVRGVADGGLVIDPRVAGVALGRARRSDPLAVLTPAERSVAERVAAGESNSEIAESLFLAEGTVKNHVSALLRKLDQRDRTALALMLYKVLH